PPPAYAFARPPIVGSREPGWDPPIAESSPLARALELRPLGWRGSWVTSVVEASPQALQAPPGPTLVPFATAVSLLLAAVGVLLKSFSLAALAGVVTIGMIAWWIWQPVELSEPEASELREATGLPVATHGRHSVAWWGMIGLLAILATVLGALVFSYFYLRLYSSQWPQGGEPLPSWRWTTAAAAALALSGLAQAWLSWRRRARPERPHWLGYASLFASGSAGLILSILALATGGARLTANAYGSITI